MNLEPLVLAIDPSQKFLGYSYRTVYNKIVRIGAIEQQTQNNVAWRLRACLMASEMCSLVEQNYEPDGMRPIVVVMEVPDAWHTERGNDSKNSEAVQKLYFTSGAIIGRLQSLPFVRSIWTVLPKEWKGHVDKANMMKRFAKLLSLTGLEASGEVTDDAAESALLAHLSYAKQMLDDDPESVTFSAPYTNVYLSTDQARGTFASEVYVEESISNVRGSDDSSEGATQDGDEVPSVDQTGAEGLSDNGGDGDDTSR